MIFSEKSKIRASKWLILPCLWLASPASAQPDLQVRIAAPESAVAGNDVSSDVQITVVNSGSLAASGTMVAGRDGYMIDITLTRRETPNGFARYSAEYSDGVLLRGGRVSNTRSIRPGGQITYAAGGTIPSDTPEGVYLLCARVDPGQRITETEERNNLACRRISITRPPLVSVRPDIRILNPRIWTQLERPDRVSAEAAPPPPPPVDAPTELGSPVSRTVLADGSIEFTYPDGSKRRLLPDGKIASVLPDGTVMVPMAIQTQGAELPQLTGMLSDWGSALSNDLLIVISNILTPTEVEAYLQMEAGETYYDIIDRRLRTITFLTRPE